MNLNSAKLALAGGIWAALGMLVMSLLNALNIYTNATGQMQEWHMFYTPSIGGTILGMIEAFVITYISLYVLAWIYNQLLDQK